MLTSLIATKLFVPPPTRNLIMRPHLLEKLNESLLPDCRLTLVSAPAGFGKTTLVSTWAASLKLSDDHPVQSVAWLSLDDGDNEPIVFFSYAISALQTQNEGIGKRALTLLQTQPPPGLENILSLLINDLAQNRGDLVLVLDDFHLVRTPAIHQALSYFIDHAPPQFHMMILTRTDPPLSLALLRGRGQLSELRLADLRFSNEEAKTLLNARMMLSLTEIDVDILNAKTEGWVAGIQMAGISLLGRIAPSQFIQTFSGNNRYILDYLTDEILDRQSSEIQTFLLSTSILDRLSTSLCDAVCGAEGNSQLMLAQLEKANLFLIPLDQERHWYRYHHLFADLLRLKLSQKFPGEMPILQKRAARWFEANGMFDEAVRYIQLANDNLELVRLLDENALSQIKQGNAQSLRKFVRLLPVELIQERPWLCILMAWYYTSQADSAEAESWLAKADVLVQQVASEQAANKMFGVIYTLRTEILHTRGDIPGTIDMAQQALALLDVDNLPSRASVYYSLGRAYYATGNLDRTLQIWLEFIRSNLHTGLYSMYAPIMSMSCHILNIQGNLIAAIEQYRQAIEHMVGQDIDRFFIAGNLYNGFSMTTLQTNELERAYELACEGLQQNRQWGNLNAIAVSLSYRAQIEIVRGNLESAWADLQEVGSIEQLYTPYFDARSVFLVSRVRYQLAKGDIAAVAHLIQDTGLNIEDSINFLKEQDYITLSRVLIAENKYPEADNLLLRLEHAAQAGGRFGRLIEILNLRAVALHRQGKTSEAVQLLESSLHYAEHEGYIRVFLDLKEPMAELLTLVVQKGTHPEYARRLLAAFPAATLATSVWDIQRNNLSLIEPLSKREIEVLQLIATGLANKEIAQKLSISLRTVKYHTTSIYTKMNVDGRAQAIVKAREQGLLR